MSIFGSGNHRRVKEGMLSVAYQGIFVAWTKSWVELYVNCKEDGSQGEGGFLVWAKASAAPVRSSVTPSPSHGGSSSTSGGEFVGLRPGMAEASLVHVRGSDCIQLSTRISATGDPTHRLLWCDDLLELSSWLSALRSVFKPVGEVKDSSPLSRSGAASAPPVMDHADSFQYPKENEVMHHIDAHALRFRGARAWIPASFSKIDDITVIATPHVRVSPFPFLSKCCRACVSPWIHCLSPCSPCA